MGGEKLLSRWYHACICPLTLWWLLTI